VEGEEDQKSEQQKSDRRDDPPLGFTRFILEGISGFQKCVAQQISQTHVVTISKQLFEFCVDFRYREHCRLI
jgi:hypothetical protein